ncbi:MAG: hypothetical protein QMD92_06575 [bacterium]|nr:hypothetical protein [bacterium]
MKRCFEVRCCPVSCYMICNAYKNGTNCWDTNNIPCCKRDNKDRCKSCHIYKTAHKKNNN